MPTPLAILTVLILALAVIALVSHVDSTLPSWDGDDEVHP